MPDRVGGVGGGAVGAGHLDVLGGHGLGQAGPPAPDVALLLHVVVDELEVGAVAHVLDRLVVVVGEQVAGDLVDHVVGVAVVVDVDDGAAVGGDLLLRDGLGGEALDLLGLGGGVLTGGAGLGLVRVGREVLGVLVALDVLEPVPDRVGGVGGGAVPERDFCAVIVCGYVLLGRSLRNVARDFLGIFCIRLAISGVLDDLILGQLRVAVLEHVVDGVAGVALRNKLNGYSCSTGNVIERPLGLVRIAIYFEIARTRRVVIGGFDATHRISLGKARLIDTEHDVSAVKLFVGVVDLINGRLICGLEVVGASAVSIV